MTARLLAIVTLAILAAFAPLSRALAADTPPATATDAAIHEMLVRRINVQHRGTGAVIVVVTPSGRHVVAHGTVAAQSRRRVDADTVFAVASITKVFTATLLADMVRRGELALDDPAAKFLGPQGAAIPSRGGRAITLADLATHTAGLPLRPGNLTSTDPDNKYDGYTHAQLYAFLGSYTLPRVPGSDYEYSNVGYGLLGQALESRAAEPYEALLYERITQPLGLRSTTLGLTPGLRRRTATGYSMEGREIRDAERGALDASGALHSTANDLARFLEAAMGLYPSTLAPALAATLETRRPGGMAPWSTQIALGWNVWRSGGREVVWKNGSAGGFRSFLGYVPDAGIGVVGLINVQSDLGVDDIGLHLLGAGVPVDMHVPRVRVPVTIDPALLDRYAGRYRFSDTDISTFVREGDRFYYLPAPDQKLELVPEGEREFFFRDFEAQVSFEVDADGTPTAAVWHQFGQDQRGTRLP